LYFTRGKAHQHRQISSLLTWVYNSVECVLQVLPDRKDSVLAAMHTAAAFVMNIPGYNRTATQANVQVLQMTGQHGIHCFILSPHTFLLAVSVHNVIAILLVAAVFPPN